MKTLAAFFVFFSVAAFAGTSQIGSLQDTDQVVGVQSGNTVDISGDSIHLRNEGSETGLDISGTGQGVVVTNGTTVYKFPDRSGTVLLNGDAFTKEESRTESTNAAETVVSNYLYYASRNTSLSNNAELRLYSGEWVNAEYDGEGTADVILDLSGISSDKVTDTLMILNCAATGTLTVATSSGDCRVVHKKDANPLELKEGLNLLTFSRYRLSNGTNDVLVTNNELE